MQFLRVGLCCSLAFAVFGCGSDDPTGDAATVDAGTDAAVDSVSEDVSSEGMANDVPGTGASMEMIGPDDRPARLLVPPGHDGVKELPVLFLLHGYGANSRLQDLLLVFSSEAGVRDVLLVLPEGTEDSGGSQFWNATSQCCNFNGSEVDDEAYLMGLLDEVEAGYPVDTNRVYMTGHSNGGFMSYRLACNQSDRVTAVLSLAGGGFLDPIECGTPSPVSVLHVHGDLDEVIPYDPIASAMVSRWIERNGCAAEPETLDPVDMIDSIEGPETLRTTYGGCQGGTQVELWQSVGADHIPPYSEAFRQQAFEWLLRQSK